MAILGNSSALSENGQISCEFAMLFSCFGLLLAGIALSLGGIGLPLSVIDLCHDGTVLLKAGRVFTGQYFVMYMRELKIGLILIIFKFMCQRQIFE